MRLTKPESDPVRSIGLNAILGTKPLRLKHLLAMVVVCVLISLLHEKAAADEASRTAIKASSAQLAALGLKKPDNTPFTPTGAGVRIGIAEAANGIPQLASTNSHMPPAESPAGENGTVTIIPTPTPTPTTPHNDKPSSHATMVTGIIMDNSNGVAQNVVAFATGGGTIADMLLNSQEMASGGRNASIINWSWTMGAPSTSNGSSLETRWADWAAITQAEHPIQDKLIVIAGNENAPNTRKTPWDNFNGITVGATSTNAYKHLANLNGKAGTQNLTIDVSPYENGNVGRFKTDIVAPGGGDGVLMASPVEVSSDEDTYYGSFAADGLNSNPNYGGTSFAAPHVTGAAALLTEFGNVKGFSTDHRVLKAVLLNGAQKDGVTDHTGDWAPVGNRNAKKGATVKPVYIGWDDDLGTGLLDVSRSLLNYDPGEKNPGPVPLIAWDIHSIAPNGSNEYDLIEPEKGLLSIRATLAWDRFLQLNDSDSDNLWDSGETFTASILDDLDLEIWDQTANQMVFYSTSDMDSIEHVEYVVPKAIAKHDFVIRTNFFYDWSNDGAETYGLAWWAVAVPEPSVLWLILSGLAGCLWMGRLRIR